MHDVPEKVNPRDYPQCSVDDPRIQVRREKRIVEKKGINHGYSVTFIFKSVVVVTVNEELRVI